MSCIALFAIGATGKSQTLLLVPQIKTVVGTGTGSYTGDGGQATAATINSPGGVVFDASGNMYIADYSNSVIRKVNTSGVISTYAGSSTTCTPSTATCGDGGAATSAKLAGPYGIAIDSAGNIYFADQFDNRIRKVTASTGVISTIAGTGSATPYNTGVAAAAVNINAPDGIAVDPSGNVFFSDSTNSHVYELTIGTGMVTTVVDSTAGGGFSGDGGQGAIAKVNNPLGLATDSLGNLYISDQYNNRVREWIASSGIIQTVVGNGTAGFNGDAGAATSAEIDNARDVGFDGAGNMIVADRLNYRIRSVAATAGVTTSSSIISTIAGNGTSCTTATAACGDGGAATSANLSTQVSGVALNPANNNIYLADENINRIREIVSQNIFPTTAVGSSITQTLTIVVSGGALTINSITPGAGLGGAAEFTVGTTSGCTLGLLCLNGTVESVPITFSPAYPGKRNEPLTIVTSNGTFVFPLTGIGTGALATLSPGTISTVAGNNASGSGTTGNGGAATSATLTAVRSATVDNAGNLFLSSVSGATVREVVASTGKIQAFAGTGTTGFSGDGGAATSATFHQITQAMPDNAGNVYIVDQLNHRIRKVNVSSGIVTTVAGTGTAGFSGDGGLATNAQLNQPSQVAIDTNGNIYLSDSVNNRIRKINAATGVISTVVGTGTAGYTGDGGLATSAEINTPFGLDVDLAGNLYLSQQPNYVVRKVTAATGVITTVAGTGSAGYTGDGGAATSATFDNPFDVKVDAAGDIYITDYSAYVIRRVNALSGIIRTVAGTGTTGFSGDGGAATSAKLSTPGSASLDADGNLYIADYANFVVRKVGVSPSSLVFPTSAYVGAADGADNPQTAVLANIGNSTLTVSVPGSGTNPTTVTSFALSGGSSCPQLSTISSPYTAASGSECTLQENFTPTTIGTNSASSVLTDNSLNSAGSTQTITLSGTGIANLTSTTLSSSVNPSSFGQSVTLTVTVSDTTSLLTPTGTVQFSIDGTAVGSSATLNGSGQATYTTATLSVGTHSVTAVYTPNSTSFTGSSATALSQVVNKSATPGFLTTSNATPNFGQTITLTDTIAIQNGVTPTGAVTFTSNGVALTGTQNTSTSGGNYIVTLTTSALTGGSDSVVATLAADTDYANTASNTVTETVAKASSASDTLTTSNASPTAGNSVTLTFAVTPVNGVAPTGTVTFKTGSTTLGTGTLNASGVATLAASALPVGTDMVTATYPGDTNYSSGSATVTETVGPASSASDTLTTSNASPTAGTSVTLTFTVTPVNGVAPTGIVTFKNGSTTLGTGTLNTSGVATLATSALPVGTDTVTASYPGDADYTAGSGSVTETVGPASSASDTLTTSNASPTAGTSVTLTFTVTPVNGVTPTGTVTFKNGSTTLGTGTLNASGVATLATSALPVGTDTVTASYPGDANYAAGSGSVTETVGPASSAGDTLTTSNASPTAGTSVTLTFTVTPVNGVAPTGTVTFKNGSTTLGTGTINASGVATLATGALPVGTDTVTASYPGDTNYAAGSGSVTETVGPASSAGDTLTTSNASPTAGTSVTLTFTVTPVNGVAPTGTVTFKNGSTTLGTGTINASGVATLATGALPVGTDTVTATYPGAANYAAGSGSVTETVGPASSASDTLTSNTTTPSAGSAVMFTFTVPPVNGVAPTGTVTFKNGSTTLGTGTLNASGVATLTTSALPAGTDTVTGTYPGDTNYAAGSASVVESVGTASSSGDTLTSSNVSPSAGTSITLTFTVPIVNGVSPTGTVTFKNGSTTLGTGALNASGIATLTTSSLAVGSATITATYPGDGNYSAGSASVVETVGPASSGADTLTSSNASPTAGSSITLTFTVPLVNGVAPTGTVTFKNGSITLGTGTINASGVATLATGALPVGTDTVTASYPGDANYAAGSGSVTETIGPASSSGDTLTTSNASPTAGTSITLTFTVPLVNGVAPTGTVTFQNGSITLGTGTINASGIATLATSALPVGTDTVTAAYPGDSSYAAGSGSVTETVGPASSASDTLTTSNASPTAGSSITLTFTVPPANGATPTGTVTFKNGSTTLGTGTLSASGVATLTTGALPVGSDTITANYPGDTNYAAGSGSLTETVGPASSASDTLTTSNASPTAGTSITLTFTVSPVNGVAPTGTVTFKNGSTALGTGTINASGVATLATSALPVGTDTITAIYPGDANYATGSGSVTETVGPASSAGDTLTASNASPTAGSSVTLTFTIPLVNGVAPTGTVTFKNGSTTLGTATVNASGVATFTTSALPVGTDALTASYPGDANYAAGSGSLNLSVGPASSSGDTLTSDTTTPSSGSPVIFTFTVPLVNGVAPTGAVTFKNGATTLGTGAMSTSGVATLTTSALPQGTDTVTANYPGDANYAAGSGSVTETVGPANSSGDTLTSNNVSPAAGAAITLTFTVPVVNGVAPTGTVTFKNGSTTLGTTALNASGVATFITSALPMGTDTITGNYPGDGNYAAGSASVSETVGPASSSGDTLTSSSTSPSAGTSITLTFTVPEVNGVVPTGTVTFKNGSATLGTAMLNSSGIATFTTAALPVGSDAITATYPGDANYAAGSGSVTETVGPASSGGDTLTSNNASPAAGSPLILTFTVPLVNGVAPTGTITFKDGNTVLGTATINSSGVATFTTSALPAGSNTVTATYPGDANYAAGSASLTQTVGPASSSGDTLTSSNTSPAAGTSITLTFTVPLVNGIAPTGTVTFKNGATVLGTAAINASGVATFTSSTLPAGTDTVTATYPGDANYGAGSASVTETVGPANPNGYSLASSNTSPSAGTSITLTFSIPLANGVAPTGSVTFKNGATVLGTGSVNASGIATLTLSSLPVGTDTVTGSYPGDTNYAAGTASTTVTVGPAASTGDSLVATPANPTAGMGITLTFTVPLVNGVAPTGTVTITSGGVTLGTATIGANGVATLTTSALPAGSDTVTATYSGDANYAAGSGSVTVTVGPASSSGDTLTTSNASPAEGSPITLTFTVPLVNGIAPTGTVTFKDGNTVIGTATVGANGIATLTSGTLPVGTDTITASYPGDANYAAGSGSVTVTVGAASSSGDTLTANPANPSAGSSVTLTFTVPLVNGIAPTGTVTFKDGNTVIGTATIGANGVATLISGTLPVGTDTITASYPGDANYAAGSGSVTVTVGAASSSGDTLTANPDNPTAGSSVTLTFTVPLVNGIAPTGTVTFKDGNTVIGTATISANGVATLTSGTLPVGSDAITASYPGDANYAAGSGSVTVTVGPASSGQDTLNASSTSPALGASVTLTFAVPLVNGIAPTGTVTFTDGNVSLGTATIGVNGIATLTTSNLPSGSNTITAAYPGDANYAAGSATVVVTVGPVSSTGDSFTASSVTSTFGAPVTFTFTIPLITGATAGGTVTFTSGGTVLGTAAVNANGVVTLTTSALPTGADTVTGSYSGNTSYSAATLSVNVTVSLASPTDTQSTSNPTAPAGQAITLSFTIPIINGVAPTGTVTFSIGATVIGTATVVSGVAAFTTSSLPPGSYSVTASYSGDTHYAAATTSLAETVIDFTIAATAQVAQTDTINPGETAAYTISLGGAASLSFGLPVKLSATGAPADAVVSFANGTLIPGTGPTSTVMSVATSPLHTSLDPPGGAPKLFYGLFLLPVFCSRKLRRRVRAIPRVVLRCFVAAALLGGIGAATGCGGGYVGTQPNTYTITVTGTSGTLSHSTTVTLTIR